MCLFLTGDRKIKTAKRNFFVYKVIQSFDNTSLVRDFPYKENTRYKLGHPLLPVGDIVQKGFHAYVIPNPTVLEKVLVKKLLGFTHLYSACNLEYSHCKMVQFIIPKGAKYYLGDSDDIVTDTIISGDLKLMPNPFHGRNGSV